MGGNDPTTDVENQYDALADRWTEFTDSPWKRGVLWPAVRSLLPPAADERVLDVGCGDGTYAAWFADRGADVAGIDLSGEMVEAARANHGDSAEFRRADVSDALPFEDRAFDLVVCQHVLSHLPSLEEPFAEFARVLEPGGSLVVSTHHPFHDFLVTREGEYPDTRELDGLDRKPAVDSEPGESTYRETERFRIRWDPEGSNPGTYYRRPLGGLVGPLLDAGFELRDVLEPDLQDVADEGVDVPRELLRRPPRTLCLRAER